MQRQTAWAMQLMAVMGLVLGGCGEEKEAVPAPASPPGLGDQARVLTLPQVCALEQAGYRFDRTLEGLCRMQQAVSEGRPIRRVPRYGLVGGGPNYRLEIADEAAQQELLERGVDEAYEQLPQEAAGAP